MSDKEIIHDGFIKEVRDHKVVVGFTSRVACDNCHAKGYCSVPEQSEKNIEVHVPDNLYSTGEKVQVILKQSHGFQAVLLAYILPFLFVLFVLVILQAITHNESLSGILSLTILIPYYFILSRYRSRLDKRINFRIMKI